MACTQIMYCSVDCQHRDWKRHKAACLSYHAWVSTQAYAKLNQDAGGRSTKSNSSLPSMADVD